MRRVLLRAVLAARVLRPAQGTDLGEEPCRQAEHLGFETAREVPCRDPVQSSAEQGRSLVGT